MFDHPAWKHYPVKFEPEVEPNVEEQFQNEEVNPQRAMGREPPQNTLDSSLGQGKPVNIRYTLVNLESTTPEINALWHGLVPHIKATEHTGDVDFNSPSFLLVEDTETTGLTGDYRRPNLGTNWYGFFWKMQKSGSQKTGLKGGRRGLGRSVFAICSELRSFFALTRTTDNPDEELLMGLSILGSRTLEDGTDWRALSHWGIAPEGEGFVQPLTDQEYIAKLRHQLQLTRGTETGTSVIVPFPTDDVTGGIREIQREIALNYMIPIARKQITIEAFKMNFNHETLPELLSDLTSRSKSYTQDLLDFVTCSYEHKTPVRISAPNSSIKDFDRGLFDDEVYADLCARFEEGQCIRVDVEVAVEKKGEGKKTATGSFCLQKTRNNQKGQDHYMRYNMPVRGESKLGSAPVFALFFTDDAALVELLGDAEGGNHWKWNSRHRDVSRKYTSASNTVLLCKNGLRSLLEVIVDSDSSEDAYTFANWFPVATNTGTLEHPGTDSEEKPDTDGDIAVLPLPDDVTDENVDDEENDESTNTDDIEIDPKPKDYKLSRQRKQGAITVKHGDAKDTQFPFDLEIKAAYEVKGRNPYKLHRPANFSFDGPQKVGINLKDADLITANSCEMVVRVRSSDFVIRVDGFDTNRDLQVEVNDV